MSKATQLVGIILLGIFTLVIINLMNDVRSTNELDYYLLQETVEASMYDAIDYSFYRETGLIKVDRDMFLESFNRRFAESVDSSNLREYKIKIIDFNETPPKASVEVTTVIMLQRLLRHMMKYIVLIVHIVMIKVVTKDIYIVHNMESQQMIHVEHVLDQVVHVVKQYIHVIVVIV